MMRSGKKAANYISALHWLVSETVNGNATVFGIGYDADGNLTNDGLFSYSWDAENRLTNMTSLTTVPTNAAVEEAWSYLPDGRWSQVVVSMRNSTGYVPVSTNRFLWDGQVLAAEVGPGGSVMIRSYMRAIIQGTGVGDLLEVSYHSTATTNFVAYDGNGNVAALVNTADGTLTANYEYGPFGEPIRMTGSQAAPNPFRFSTKYDDDESDLLYYGYRYYKPATGIWVSRDPKAEMGGKNLYCFVRNMPVFRSDRLGLDENGPPTSCNNDCCDWTTRFNGLDTLTRRWEAAAEYLHGAGVGLDPNGVWGVSCIDSANSILAFMSPIPKCWKCYIETRGSWNYGDENYIRCDDASHHISTFPSYAFDWWYEEDMGYTTYTPISLNMYAWIFPWGPWPQPLAWGPAPHDTCWHQSNFPPENYERWLKPLADHYGRSDGNKGG